MWDTNKLFSIWYTDRGRVYWLPQLTNVSGRQTQYQRNKIANNQVEQQLRYLGAGDNTS